MATQDTQDTQATLRKIAEREQAEAAAPEALVEKFDVTEAKPKRTRKAKPNGKSIVRLDADGQPVSQVPAEPEPEPAAAEPKPKRTRKAKPAPAAAPTPEDRNAFQWPKAASAVLLDYLTARVSAEFDPEHPARPYINSNGKLFVHSTDWRDWLLEQGLAPSKSEAAKPLRDNVGVVRATPLPGMDKALGFYQGTAPKGTEKLPRRESRAASGPRAPRTPFGKLTDEQRAVVTAALTAFKPGRSAQGKQQADVRDELLAQLP